MSASGESAQTPSPDRLAEVVGLRNDVSQLIHAIHQAQRACDRLERGNQNLQDYVGTLMDSTGLRGSR